MQGPSPTVNCSRSATSATSELAPSGIRCCDASTRLSPAPSTASVRAHARASRTGSSSGPARAGSVTSASAASKRSAMRHRSSCVAAAAPSAWSDRGAAAIMGRVERRARVLPYGDRALLVEVADLAAVAAVRASAGTAPLPGQRELVPAARTVLVVLDRAAVGPRRRDPAPALAGARRRRRAGRRGRAAGGLRRRRPGRRRRADRPRASAPSWTALTTPSSPSPSAGSRRASAT